MSPFILAAVALLVAMLPIGVLALRGNRMEAVIAYEALSSIVVMIFILLPEGFDRSSEFEFPVLFAILLLGGSLVFLHALERWL